MKIIVTPNAFKGSLSANEVASAITEGILKVMPEAEVIKMPIADGGDGTLTVLINAMKGAIKTFKVQDPLGRVIDARMGVVEDGTIAILEMAEASGIRLLDKEELNPMIASSFGTGQQIRQAIEDGAKQIILCLGGSATVDGGMGVLKALGFSFLDHEGNETGNMLDVRIIKRPVGGFEKQLSSCSFSILSDVDNHLLGERGAAKVFGPQKGADEAMVSELEAGLSNLRTLVHNEYGVDVNNQFGAGSAGGCGAFLSFFLAAEVIRGTDFVIDKIGLKSALPGCDYLITGEGNLDGQTSLGKGPAVVAMLAKSYGCQTIGLAGAVDHGSVDTSLFDAVFSIQSKPCSLEHAIQNSYNDLVNVAYNVFRLLG